MDVKEFIREKMAHLAEAFPHVTIKYNYDKLIECHIIELSPEKEYYDNPKLNDAWMDLLPNFWDQFPAEDICFISTDSTLRVESPEFAYNLESNLLAKEFIREKLAHLAEAFPHITIKYKFNELIRTHIVELSPVKEYYNNPELDDAWLTLVQNFWDQFPAEDIGFISTDCTLRIENPEFAYNLESNLLMASSD